jgi:hypothetical protein
MYERIFLFLSLSPLCLNLKFDKKRLDDWDHRRAAIPSVLAQSVIITPPIRNGRKHFITRWREVYAHCVRLQGGGWRLS